MTARLTDVASRVPFSWDDRMPWLELDFPVADGASGGVFNLAMWCAGKSGTEIADAWRTTRPLDFVAVNPRPWVGLSSLERFRKKVLRKLAEERRAGY